MYDIHRSSFWISLFCLYYLRHLLNVRLTVCALESNDIQHLAYISYRIAENHVKKTVTASQMRGVQMFQEKALEYMPILNEPEERIQAESVEAIKNLRESFSDEARLFEEGMWSLLHMILQGSHIVRPGEFLLTIKDYLSTIPNAAVICTFFEKVNYENIYLFDDIDVVRVWLAQQHYLRAPHTYTKECSQCFSMSLGVEAIIQDDRTILSHLTAKYSLYPSWTMNPNSYESFVRRNKSAYTLYHAAQDVLLMSKNESKDWKACCDVHKLRNLIYSVLPMLREATESLSPEQLSLIQDGDIECDFYCGFWKLVHTLIEHTDQPLSVVKMVVNCVEYFVNGSYSHTFHEIISKSEMSAPTDQNRDKSRLWMWKVHNRLNEVAGHMFFPSPLECPKCYNKDKDRSINEVAVKKYLKHTYASRTLWWREEHQPVRIAVPIVVVLFSFIGVIYFLRRSYRFSPAAGAHHTFALLRSLKKAPFRT